MQDGGRYNPWRGLRSRAHLRLRWRVLPDGQGAAWEGTTITVDPRLSRTERRCALTHELAHEERGVGWPDASDLTMAAEERIVRRLTAARLVPLDDLRQFVQAETEYGCVTGQDIADEYDVTLEVALLAGRMLQESMLTAELRATLDEDLADGW